MVVGELAYEKDVVIIGGGPGGYQAAIRAAQLGRKVTLIEKAYIGGVCLHKGCIPSKLYTEAADRIRKIKAAGEYGIELSFSAFQLEKLMNEKDRKTAQLKKGVEELCKSNEIELVKGNAFFLSADRIGIENGEAYQVFRFKHCLIATGSTPKWPSEVSPRSEKLLDCWSVFSLKKLPDELIIYGSGYIALEMAMSFQAFGARTTIMLDQEKDDFGFDAAVNREIGRILKKNRIKVYRGAKLLSVEESGSGVEMNYELGGENKQLKGSCFLTAAGFRPNTANLGLDRAGVEIDTAGFIKIDQQGKTSVTHIFAAGDVAGGPPLASKAIRQGKAAAEMIAGLTTEADLRFAPVVIHTQPPIAYAGLTGQEALEAGYQIDTGTFPFSSLGYASVKGSREGMAKVIFEKETGFLLGVHMIGDGAQELIYAGVSLLEMAAREEDMLFPVYAHPSSAEALLEAVESLKARSIHLPAREKAKT
ncbi:dihydrolipoyl dehydrogenase [Bacillus infantis]|uniref:dihydrolipoyl dehydrogenase n=1 Tax=Bacillus infantis TaxID=324767 RepID=UPI003CE87DE0